MASQEMAACVGKKKDDDVVSKKKQNAKAGYMAKSEIVVWGYR